MGYLNYNQQKKNLEYQKKLQKKMFAREDTAVQRRAKDLKAAGLSQTLAAGGGAQAGPVIHTQAPQISGYETGGIQENILRQKQTSKTEAEESRIIQDERLKTLMTFLVASKTSYQDTLNTVLSWNYKLAHELGLPTTGMGDHYKWIMLGRIVKHVAPELYKKVKPYLPIEESLIKPKGSLTPPTNF